MMRMRAPTWYPAYAYPYYPYYGYYNPWYPYYVWEW